MQGREKEVEQLGTSLRHVRAELDGKNETVATLKREMDKLRRASQVGDAGVTEMFICGFYIFNTHSLYQVL